MHHQVELAITREKLAALVSDGMCTEEAASKFLADAEKLAESGIVLELRVSNRPVWN